MPSLFLDLFLVHDLGWVNLGGWVELGGWVNLGTQVNESSFPGWTSTYDTWLACWPLCANIATKGNTNANTSH